MDIALIASVTIGIMRKMPAGQMPNSVAIVLEIERQLARDLTAAEQNVVGVVAAGFTVGHVKAEQDARQANIQAETSLAFSAVLAGQRPQLTLC